MKVITKLSAVFFALTLFLLSGSMVSAGTGEGEDRNLSPYFFVKSDNPDTDQLPLKSTSAAVNISGVIADVKVTQIYRNEGKNPLEAIYVFPASSRAAVYGMKMTIGERIINAKVKKREEARQEYEDAKKQGKSASLLEQHRPNVFQMNVANILPGDNIKVELSYTELLVPTDRIYEFVYPTVVGPRYSNQPAETADPSEKWVQNPYLHKGEAPHNKFDINVNISAGMPVQKIFSSSHKISIKYNGASDALVQLDKSEEYGGNRDYILKYQLAGEQIESGLLLYEGEKEKFFLLMLHPPKRVAAAQIPGREYIFIIDVSGSMHGYPLDISKKLLKDLIGNLRQSDVFNIMLFSGGSSVMSEHSLPATSGNISRAINLIDRQQGGGGTELLPALKRALSLPKAHGFSRTIVIATDGYVTVEEEVFDLMRKNLDNSNMFAFGIGTSVNRHIIEGIAHIGMGEPFVITKPENAPAKAEAFRTMIQSPVLTQIRPDFGNFDVYDVEPLSIPDVLADRPVIIFGKWRGKSHGKIMLKGISGDRDFTDIIDVDIVKPSKNNSALKYLWARHRIALLSDYNMLRHDDRRVGEVTDLGLNYNLLTKYTSFVAIDSEIRNKNGTPVTIKQPLPLPEGVSDYAVGGISRAPVPALFLNSPISAKKEVMSRTAEEEKKDKVQEAGEIRIDNITASNGLSKETLKALLQPNLKNISVCFEKKAFRGKLVIKMVIAPNGSVKTIGIANDELKDRDIVQCITKKIKNWKIPVQYGREVTTTFSLIFN